MTWCLHSLDAPSAESHGLRALASHRRNSTLLSPRSLQYVGLSGPTYFEQIIRTATEKAQADMARGWLRYTVLLILTDGEVNDVQATVKAIVEASNTPLSIVIVGVGDADFSVRCNCRRWCSLGANVL